MEYIKPWLMHALTPAAPQGVAREGSLSYSRKQKLKHDKPQTEQNIEILYTDRTATAQLQPLQEHNTQQSMIHKI